MNDFEGPKNWNVRWQVDDIEYVWAKISKAHVKSARTEKHEVIESAYPKLVEISRSNAVKLIGKTGKLGDKMKKKEKIKASTDSCAKIRLEWG